jgi:hypothetical protein
MTAVTDELRVLQLVVSRLRAAGVEHMLTGSVAMAWYAEPRQTRDIDIVVELPGSKVDEVVEAFSTDFYVDADTARVEARTRGMFNLIHSELVLKVDMIIRKADAYGPVAFGRRRKVLMAPGLEVDIIAPEDLILAKLQWALQGESDFQLRDVRNLMRSAFGLDEPYLREWAAKTGVGDLLAKVSTP